MGVLALAILFLFHKKYSLRGSIYLGVTVFVTLFLLETAVVVRYCGILSHGFGIDLWVGINRILHGNHPQVDTICNIAAFVPFGFFLSKFLASMKRFGTWHRILLSTLAALGLSLCIEVLQLVLKVGFFEVTDLVLNTAGGFLGASLSAVGRRVFRLQVK